MSPKDKIIQQYQQISCNVGGVSADNLERFALYLDTLQDWTKRIDLIAPARDEEVIEKHFIDSILAMKLLASFLGEKFCAHGLIDIGSGAGFPGLVAAILGDFQHVTLVEPRQNRVGFLKEIRRKLKLDNVQIEQSSIEDFAKSSGIRYGAITSRALGKTELLQSLAPKLLIEGGCLSELQSQEQAEQVQAQNVLSYQLPRSGAKHALTIIVT